MKKNGKTKKVKKQNKREYNRGKFLLLVTAVISCCLAGGLLARYMHQTVTDPGQVTSEYFYFTADLLGDTKMVKTDGTVEEGYSFGEKSTEETWYLYGGSRHELEIQVQNFYDELRYTKEAISFQATLSAKKADGTKLWLAEEESAQERVPSLIVGTVNTDQGAEDGADQKNSGSENRTYTLPGNQKSSASVTLSIPSNSDWKYEENTELTVELKSTVPYTKTLTLHFILYAKDAALRYQVKDSVGSPYAELIIMTNVEGSGNTEESVQPFLKWPSSLLIDNTNKLTFHYEDGVFKLQDGMESRNMQISESFATGRSESIYFFKEDPSANFSRGETVVTPDTEHQYTIDLTSTS